MNAGENSKNRELTCIRTSPLRLVSPLGMPKSKQFNSLHWQTYPGGHFER